MSAPPPHAAGDQSGQVPPSHAALIRSLASRYAVSGAPRERSGGVRVDYDAVDVRGGGAVCISVLKAGSVDGSETLALKLKGLEHPGIVPVRDVGVSDGLVYVVTSVAEGQSLRARLKTEKQLPIAEAVGLACDMASALDIAHRHGLVHRDLTPDNIVCAGNTARVTGWGHAVARVDACEAPAYMSPEHGEVGQVDARSDVYALGCLLYEMLAGEAPYGGPSAEVVMRRHQRAAIPEVTVLRATVPSPLSAVIRRALAKLPSDRFQSAEAMVAALEGHGSSVSGSLVASANGRGRKRAAQWLAMLIIVLLALLVMFVLR